VGLLQRTWSKNLPSPAKTWEVSKTYVLDPLAKRGELDQGILRFAWYSLVLVAKGTPSPCWWARRWASCWGGRSCSPAASIR
jgi:hypothetical protein